MSNLFLGAQESLSPCPIRSSAPAELVWVKHGFRYARCSDRRPNLVDPMPPVARRQRPTLAAGPVSLAGCSSSGAGAVESRLSAG